MNIGLPGSPVSELPMITGCALPQTLLEGLQQIPRSIPISSIVLTSVLYCKCKFQSHIDISFTHINMTGSCPHGRAKYVGLLGPIQGPSANFLKTMLKLAEKDCHCKNQFNFFV
jgi:hypothetical protein